MTRNDFGTDIASTLDIAPSLDNSLFALCPEDFDTFLDALENLPAPGPKLKALLRRVPAWEA